MGEDRWKALIHSIMPMQKEIIQRVADEQGFLAEWMETKRKASTAPEAQQVLHFRTASAAGSWAVRVQEQTVMHGPCPNAGQQVQPWSMLPGGLGQHQQLQLQQ